MATATSVPQSHSVLGVAQLPCGTRFLTVACESYETFKVLPAGLEFEGRVYGRTGWNSDFSVAYYRTTKTFATGV